MVFPNAQEAARLAGFSTTIRLDGIRSLLTFFLLSFGDLIAAHRTRVFQMIWFGCPLDGRSVSGFAKAIAHSI